MVHFLISMLAGPLKGWRSFKEGHLTCVCLSCSIEHPASANGWFNVFAAKDFKNMLIWVIDYFELKALEKQSVRGGFLWTRLICLKTDPPKETPLSSIPFPGMSSTRKNWLVTGKKTRPWHHTQTNFATNDHIFHPFSKDPFIFPNNHLLSSKRPSPSPAFPMKMSSNPKS